MSSIYIAQNAGRAVEHSMEQGCISVLGGRGVYLMIHDKSMEMARDSAEREEVADRVTLPAASAKEFPGSDYDFVSVFDCLHDMGDPVGAAAHVRRALKHDGSWMIVEPFANDELQNNFTPVGRVYYSFSTLLCTACSRSQEVGLCLGAQAGEKRMREVGEFVCDPS